MNAGAAMSLRARWVIPVEADPIANGLVIIEGTRIRAVEPARGRSADFDLGNVAITPGFVNAHTHLELTSLGDEPNQRPCDQVDWLRRVIARARTTTLKQRSETIARNLWDSVAAGTTTIADISTGGCSWKQLLASPLRGTVFCEVLGLRRPRAMETSAIAFTWLRTAQRDSARIDYRLRPGLSPHAPYSTVGWLYERAASAGVPLTTHLAELPEESELLTSRSGPLRDLLESIDAWGEGWEPLGSRSADYVRRGPLRDSDWLIAHGTYLDETDFWQLRPQAAPKQQRVAVVYCPRSTAYFGHGPHPYQQILERGAVVCLGTDSLASAPSLSMLEEMRFLQTTDRSLPAALILTMATLSGAWALRREQEVGSLLPEKRADLAIIALPEAKPSDPHDLLTHAGATVAGTMIDGRFVAGPWTSPR